MAAEIRILLADDHPVVRSGLRQAIESEAGLKVVGEAGDGRTALEQVESLRPDVAVLDIDMPEMGGLEVARAIADRNLPVEVVFLTIHREEDLFNEAVNLGAKGYVLKDSALTDLVACVKEVARGRRYASPALTDYLFSRRRRAASLAQQRPELKDLSSTEMSVLRLVAEYKTSREIAESLGVSPRTVETHRNNICNKLGLRGSHALMKFALDNKSELSEM